MEDRNGRSQWQQIVVALMILWGAAAATETTPQQGVTEHFDPLMPATNAGAQCTYETGTADGRALRSPSVVRPPFDSQHRSLHAHASFVATTLARRRCGLLFSASTFALGHRLCRRLLQRVL